MFADITKPAAPLPQPRLKTISKGISLLPPLSRRGHGPGLIVLGPDSEDQLKIAEGVPSILTKWAEEGFAVVEIQNGALGDGTAALEAAVSALKDCEECQPKDKIGLVVYEPSAWSVVAPLLGSVSGLVGAVLYADAAAESSLIKPSVPVLEHFAGASPGKTDKVESVTKYFYPNAKSYLFALPFQEEFNYRAESVSHTRSLTFLKPLIGGPYFDLETIWEEHTYYEFADRSVEHTMSTMVAEPYVNHVPTITGGIGREKLTKFYRDNFIFNNSADTDLELISRTIGIDRVIDEFIFKFTHDLVVDWILPGIPPTGKKVEVPFTAVVNIRGDRLYHEHITWDQGTVLRQLGLLPEYLPYPYPVPGASGEAASTGKYEYRVPVAGIDTASKMKSMNSVPSNEMFEFKVRKAE